MEYRTLVHAPEYTARLHELGDIQRLDDVLAGVEWALGQGADHFPIVRGTADTRLVRTDPAGDLPALQIWFRIEEEDDEVHLLYICTSTACEWVGG